jgi:hypothetical protein
MCGVESQGQILAVFTLMAANFLCKTPQPLKFLIFNREKVKIWMMTLESNFLKNHFNGLLCVFHFSLHLMPSGLIKQFCIN